MILHSNLSDVQLYNLIRSKAVLYGGNSRLKIYGMLHCKSGKRLNRNNRVFFATGQVAIDAGYRPCGHCMRKAYKNYKDGII